MQAIILAAGRGSNLFNLTREKPKCMLHISDETILERQVRILTECGISEQDILVVIGYKSESVNISGNIKRIINNNYRSTSNTYSLWLALKEVNDDCIILDGDLIFQKTAIEKLIVHSGNNLLILNKETGYGDTGVVKTQEGTVKEFGKHIHSNFTYTGIFKICHDSLKKVYEEVSKEKYWDKWYSIPLNNVLGEIKFSTLSVSNDFYEVNSYEDYLKVQEQLSNNVRTILVTGANGFLGKKVYNILKRDYEVIGVCGHGKVDGLTTVDLSDYEKLSAYISLVKPSIIINTAGIASPEKCESDKYEAQKINVWAVDNLVKICKKQGIKLIHISTDYVFDGDKEEDYQKFDERRPKNYYGETKLQAENIVNTYNNSLIVRIPIIYGYNDENDKETFPIKVIKTLICGDRLEVDNRQIRYPVLIDEIAFSLAKLINRTGIIHITSNQGVTKYEWAQIIAHEFHLDDSKIIPIDGNILDRPLHTHLSITEGDFVLSSVIDGTKIIKKQMHCAFKLIYKSLPNQNIYNKNIGNYRYGLGRKLANCIPENVKAELDYIVPVPSSGIYYAIGLAEETKIPFMQALVKPDTKTRSFQIADISLRERVIQNKIYTIKEFLTGKTIALVDEAIFTGTTLRVVCDMLWACGVKKIYICIPTPICKNRCRQYVQPERKLLCEDEDIDLNEYFNVNGVFFQKYDNFIDSISDIDNICYECFENV